MYYNTTKLTEAELTAAIKNAKNQDVAVLAVYRFIFSWPPSLVYEELKKQGKNWPLTSIRRSISDLTREGKLEKVEGMACKGLYGKPEGLWALVP